MSYEELIKAFAEKLGGAVDLSPDADGTVMLDVDGLELTIMGMEEIGQVALIGIIGVPPPEEKMERLYRAMLEANHNFAGTSGGDAFDQSRHGQGLALQDPAAGAGGRGRLL